MDTIADRTAETIRACGFENSGEQAANDQRVSELRDLFEINGVDSEDGARAAMVILGDVLASVMERYADDVTGKDAIIEVFDEAGRAAAHLLGAPSTRP